MQPEIWEQMDVYWIYEHMLMVLEHRGMTHDEANEWIYRHWHGVDAEVLSKWLRSDGSISIQTTKGTATNG